MRDVIRAFAAIAIFALLSVAAVGPAGATLHIVNQSGLTFTPPSITITEGDTVRWVWSAGSHTVTNGTGAADPQAGTLFDVSLNSANQTREYVFTAAGVYPYFCRPHEVLNMKGTVTVDVASGVRTPVASIATLRQSHPNPFGGLTAIEYTLAKASDVRLDVYDARGRRVVTLEEGARGAGPHRAAWNGRAANGVRLPAGIYFYRLSAGATVQTKKLVLVR